MCGIAGIVDFSGSPAERSTRVDRMTARLHHRGPDGSGRFESQGVSLGHTRLALLDPAGGAQPITDPSGCYTLVYNGEVYNHTELRRELRADWTFRTRCDSEVVLAAYVAWGPDCLERLIGMFAFFVWNAHEERGFAARDRLGVKPLVYAWENAREGARLIFASEAKAIVETSEETPGIDRFALLEYLCAPCFSGVETSPFQGLEHLAPGSMLEVDRHGLRLSTWGRYSLDPEAPDRVPELERAMAHALPRAVERTLVADVPVCTYLSGGLDSTLISALAARIRPDLQAFSIRFRNQQDFDYECALIVNSDDAPHARSASKAIGIPLTFADVDRDLLDEDLTGLCEVNDALPAWEQEFAQMHLARTASREFKAVLVGDAADETHFGYHFVLDDDAVQSPSQIFGRFARPPIRKSFWDDPTQSLDAHYRDVVAEHSGIAWGSGESGRLAASALIVHRWLPRLLHNGDIHAMACSLEARVPFADEDLLEIARRVPASSGFERGNEKALLRRSARGLMPERPRRRKKSALPFDQNAGVIYQQLARDVLGQAESRDLLDHYLDTRVLDALTAPERALDEVERSLLFRVIALSRWSSIYSVNP